MAAATVSARSAGLQLRVHLADDPVASHPDFLLARKTAALTSQPVEFTQVMMEDGSTLDTLVIKPTDFDPSRRYPMLVQVYGEPADTLVEDQWATGRLVFRAIANEGYAVVAFDNRGTPAPKGAAWRKAVYGHIGDLGADRARQGLRRDVLPQLDACVE